MQKPLKELRDLPNMQMFASTDKDMPLPPLGTINGGGGDGVRFDGVTFAYRDEGEPVLDDISFDIPRGSCVALPELPQTFERLRDRCDLHSRRQSAIHRGHSRDHLQRHRQF